MACPLCDTLAAARAGQHPGFIAELSESTLVLAETQGCPGWCVLVLNDHHEHLELLPPDRCERLLRDVAAAGAAIRRALDIPRLNYACLCNQVPHLHWHLIPRRPTDPPGTVWSWPEDRQRGRVSEANRQELRDAIARAITNQMANRK